ncbi:MAG: HAD hydrolase family protein [Planctomycetes bacterium]|nr:HAD hydrolase family protein [Planctomycetota bacterium]
MNPDLEGIRMLLTDVDGVLTDGRIHFDPSSMLETKAFHVHDAAGLVYWHRSGRMSGFLSGRSCAVVEARAREIGVTEVCLGHLAKGPVLDEILAKHGLQPHEVAYVGDDILDLPVLRRVGFAAAPADARPEIREVVDHVCVAPGGFGAVREVIEVLMKAQGTWGDVLESQGLA